MNRTSFSRWFPLIAALAAVSAYAEPRAFTDDQGRSVQAELVGIRGANVVLATGKVRGQWPLSRLSPPDQDYVRQWQTSHTAVKHVQLQITERDGIGERGEFKGGEKSAGGPLSGLPVPGAPEVKTVYKHYEIAVNNPAAVDASYLRVAYVVYVVQPDGSIGIQPGAQDLERIAASGSSRLLTEGASADRTKATQFKVSVSNGNLSVAEKTKRSRDQFGGVWVRVTGPDGTLIGEAKRLSPAVAQLNPPWQEAEVAEDIPILESLSGLLEKLKQALPPPPSGGPGGKGFPKLPGPP